MIPLQTCNRVGCNKLIPYNQRYCKKHLEDSLKRNRGSEKWNYSYRKRVYGKYEKFYHSRRWRRMSRNYRAKHPFCKLCRQKGLYTHAQIVDHIIPIRTPKGWQKRWDESNFQSLCIRCHNRKSLEDRDEFQLAPLNYEGGQNFSPGVGSGSFIFKNI